MIQTETSVEELLGSYHTRRPAEVATVRSILKALAPMLPGRVLGGEGGLPKLPAHALYGLLSADRNRWTEAVASKLPPGNSYQRAYPRFIRRLLAYGEGAGLVEPDQYLISPAWRALMIELATVIMADPPARRSRLKGAFKRLALWATATGLSPGVTPVVSLDGQAMVAFHEVFPRARDGGFYQARVAWNRLVEARPNLGLAAWVPSVTGNFEALPPGRWPGVVKSGLESLFSREGLGSWREQTRLGYRHRLGAYLGVLDSLGMDVAGLFAEVADGTDAMRLLFQGLAPGTGRATAGSLADAVMADPGFLTDMLGAMRALEGSFDGRASEANPLLMAAVTALVEAKKLTTARNLLVKAMAINRGLLGLSERHTLWLSRRIVLVEQLGRKNPGAYALKKRAVFRSPRLWAELVKARVRLRAHTLDLEAAWRAARGAGAKGPATRWAVALRNEVLLGLMLCYPLRVNNLVGMQLERHYRQKSHHIYFPAEETKNEKEIDYELPEGGALGDLRELMAQYLSEARPVLLAGRSSAYVFVPEARGGTSMPTKGVNAILADLSERFFRDVLPEGVLELNPHLLRHAAASYHLAIGQNLNLAAQILNDSPVTVIKSYADVLENKKEATKCFLSGFTG